MVSIAADNGGGVSAISTSSSIFVGGVIRGWWSGGTGRPAVARGGRVGAGRAVLERLIAGGAIAVGWRHRRRHGSAEWLAPPPGANGSGAWHVERVSFVLSRLGTVLTGSRAQELTNHAGRLAPARGHGYRRVIGGAVLVGCPTSATTLPRYRLCRA